MVEVVRRFDVVGAVVERNLVDERPQEGLLFLGIQENQDLGFRYFSNSASAISSAFSVS